jgi:hypothetical protein
MPPADLQHLFKSFKDSCWSIMNTLVDPSGNTIIEERILHDKCGAGVPDLARFAPALYEATREMAIHNHREVPTVELVPNELNNTAYHRHNLDPVWLFYSKNNMTPAQFTTALAIRLKTTPPHINMIGSRCNCGFLVTTAELMFRHTLECDQATPITHTIRHNRARDALAACARRYGIMVTVEPTMYVYDDGKKHRPDLTFHLGTSAVVTDITIVKPHDDPGDAAAAADKAKTRDHEAATSRLGHVFIPCATELFGTFGKGWTSLLNKLTQHLQPFLQYGFRQQMTHDFANALATGRADAVNAAAARLRWE